MVVSHSISQAQLCLLHGAQVQHEPITINHVHA